MRYLLVLSALFITLSGFTQDNKNILKKIRLTNSVLESYRKSERSSVYELKLLNRKLNEQQQLIQSIENDLEALDKVISKLQDSLAQVKSHYQSLQEEYKQMVLFAYLNKDRYQPFLFIFSAKSFNQAYKRYLYIQNYSSRRKHYISLMEKTAKKLEKQEEILQGKVKEKEKLNDKYQQQLNALQNEYDKKERLLSELREKEAKVRQKLKNQVKLARELDKKISQSILNNLSPNTMEGADVTESSEDAFRNYKGELPWPVNNGVIMNGFGEKPHPFLKNVTVSNSGIDISTLANAEVKAVFDGKVVKVMKIPGINYSVLLKHGSYYTLYSNLKDLRIEKGDYVFADDVLGQVDFDFQNEEQYYIKFQVWHKSNKLNPVAWLKDK